MRKKQFIQDRRAKQLMLPKLIKLNSRKNYSSAPTTSNEEAVVIFINRLKDQSVDKDSVWLKSLERVAQQNAENFYYNVEKLAHDMNLSRQHLTRRLKEITGLTALQFLKEIRLKRAKFFLENNQPISVKAVALNNGYMDIKYFSRLFQQRFGILPSKVR